MAHLLLIDDDPDLLHDQVAHVFPAPKHRVEIAQTGADGLKRVADTCPDVILLDLRLPDQSGLDVLTKLRRFDARIPVVFVTVVRSADSAIEAMRHGAYDYLLKPIDLQKLDRVINEALKVARLMREPAVVTETLPADEVPGEAIIGSCPGMQEAYKAIGRVADQSFPVLITGETGTGKELVARAIYQHSPRAKAPFLALNCAAIPENLLESELFGHEKGSFTGADRRRIGKFEQCSGGTLFLDEIGDMPPSTQAKMLRVLQEQAFERVGGNETIRTDVRLIAATHRDLKAWSEEGKFRPDLYYRLGVFSIHLPALRERGDDLSLLIRHFLRRFGRELGRDVREAAPEGPSGCAPTRGRAISVSFRACSSRRSCGPAATSSFRPSSRNHSEGWPRPPQPRPARCRGLKSSSSGCGWTRTSATPTPRRTATSTDSCCLASSSTLVGASTRPPCYWESPARPCA